MLRPLIVVIALATGLNQAAAAPIVIDFDRYPDGSLVPEGYTIHDQWRSLGVVFTMGDTSRAAYAVPHATCSRSSPNHVGGDPIVIAWFVDPLTGEPAVTDFAGTAQDLCWGLSEGIEMSAYDIHGDLVGWQFNSGAGHLSTFSFPTPTVARLVMVEHDQGIDDFTFNTPVPVGPTGAPVVPVEEQAAASLRITPNPAFGGQSVRIQLAGGDGRASTIRIHDTSGRMVRSLAAGGASGHTVEWDGRDEAGRVVPPGVYLVLWSTGGATRTARIACVR